MMWLYPFLLAYLLGSIPFGLILTRLTGAGDLRAIGSGNIGATNVLRTGRKGLAAATLLLDMGKGAAAVLIVERWLPGYQSIAGLGALIGHCFPVWLRFRGGKGVATMLGVSFGLYWQIGLVCAGVWLAVALSTRISSLGGIASAIAAPMTAFVLFKFASGDLVTIGWGFVLFDYTLALISMALLVIFQHRANIVRLLAGTEPKIGSKF